MKTSSISCACWSLSLLLGALAPLSAGAANNDRALAASRQLGHGISLGSALDAPQEGEWGVTLEESYFAAIADAGFDSVVIPVRWSAHADAKPPYRIDSTFLARVDWAVGQGLQHHLAVLLKIHQYQGFDAQPENELPRYRVIWEQLAEHFRPRPAAVMFEISNEPGYIFDAPRWNEVTADILAIIRRSNPDRAVVVCPIFDESMGAYSVLELPEDERNLLVRLHYFLPLEFAMQGASWLDGADRWLGTKWLGTTADQQAIVDDFDRAAQWAREHNRIIYLGEFGAVNMADMESRVRWTQFVATEAGKHGMPWAYWEFCSVFGAYDAEAKAWKQPLLDALVTR